MTKKRFWICRFLGCGFLECDIFWGEAAQINPAPRQVGMYLGLLHLMRDQKFSNDPGCCGKVPKGFGAGLAALWFGPICFSAGWAQAWSCSFEESKDARLHQEMPSTKRQGIAKSRRVYTKD